jgi:hypothetical protein
MNDRASFRALFLSPACALLLGGCSGMPAQLAGSASPVEVFHVHDIKTGAASAAVTSAASAGLGKHATDNKTNTPIRAIPHLPAAPGRFRLASQEGSPLRTPSCEGAVWAASAQRGASGDDNVALFGCLFQYQDGYQLDTYATFIKPEGGWLRFPRFLRAKLRGTPEQWVNRAVLDMVTSIEAASGARAVHIDGQPLTPFSPPVQAAPAAESAPTASGQQ